MDDISRHPQTEALTAAQLLRHLAPYDLDRVTFQMPDGLPIVVAHIDTDATGGAVITLSDESASGSNLLRHR